MTKAELLLGLTASIIRASLWQCISYPISIFRNRHYHLFHLHGPRVPGAVVVHVYPFKQTNLSFGKDTLVNELCCFISRPRTGTNYLMSLLRSSPSIDARTEIFHPNVPYGLNDDEIESAIGQSVASLTDHEKAVLVRRNPQKICDTLRDKSRQIGIPIAFKVFPRHLDFAMLNDVIIASDNITKIIVDRRPIDSYISMIKANELQEWTFVDTTAIRPTINAQQFCHWYERNQRWYEKIAEKLKIDGQAILALHYEEFTCGSNAENYRFIANRLADFGIALTQAAIPVSSRHTKQDKSVSVHDKVANYEEFIRDLGEENSWMIEQPGFITSPRKRRPDEGST